MNIQNNIWILITKRIQGSLTPEEEQILDKAISEDNKIQRIIDILSKSEISFNIEDQEIEKSIQNTWNTLSKKISQGEKKRINIKKYIAIAASIAILIAAGTIIYFIKHASSPILMVENTETNTKQINLPDGSSIWLGEGAKISYPENFSSSMREVSIEGEAFFDVMKDAKRPFIVKTDAANIKVFGTRFNVNTKGAREILYVILESGSVGIEKKSKGKKDETIILEPNDMASISKTSGEIELTKVDPELYTVWKDDKFTFKSQTLENIAFVLSYCYKVDIQIDNEKLKKEVFTGKFDKNQTIDDILKIIKINTPFEYKNENGIYIIK